MTQNCYVLGQPEVLTAAVLNHSNSNWGARSLLLAEGVHSQGDVNGTDLSAFL